MNDCRPETAAAGDWHFCPAPAWTPGMRLRALVQARVVDEITGRPVPALRVGTPDRRVALHVAARVAGDGLVGLAGWPSQLFPQLAAAPAHLPLRIDARGYLPRELDGVLGPFAGFPDQFVPLDHGQVSMHRTGVAFQGRVARRGTPVNTPLGGAAVEIDGVWPTYPPAGVMPAAVMEPARLVALAPGLYADHAAATLVRCDVVENLAQAKRLLASAAPGSRRLRLHDRATLSVGMPLRIGAGDRAEVIGIRAIDTGLSDDQPAWVELDHALRHLHRPPTQAVPLAVPATHDPRSLARAALAGDPTAFLTAAAPWPAGSLVRIDDGANPPEYQQVDHYAAVADADGRFRLPRLSRVALFRLRATHPTPPQPLLLTIEPDYGLAEQFLAVPFE